MAQYDNWYQLPPEMDKWQSIILENLSRKVPEIPKYVAGIELDKVDPVLGSADGMVYLLNGVAGAPITIRQGKLAPIDVMMSKDEQFYPVNESFLQKLYADNVIGKPASDPIQNEGLEDGPARKIESIPTITPGVKRASLWAEAPKQSRDALREKVASSPTLAKFFLSYIPDIFEEPQIKVATEKVETPDLMVLSKDNTGYLFNGERVSIKEASEFLECMQASERDRKSLLHGGTLVFDYREKTAALISLTVNAQNIDINKQDEGTVPAPITDSNCYIATAMLRNGTPVKGFACKVHQYQDLKYQDRQLYHGPQEEKSLTSRRMLADESNWLFVSTNFWALQPDILFLEQTPITEKSIYDASSGGEPRVGVTGIVIREHGVSGPFSIHSVTKHGGTYFFRSQYQTDHPDSFNPKYAKFVVLDGEETRLLTAPEQAFLGTFADGVSYTVSLNADDNIIYKGKEYSYANFLYKSMAEMGLSWEDALRVANESKNGQVVFKTAAYDEPVTPVDRAPAQQRQIDMDPVSFDDADSIAKMNDPNLMDNYLSGKLVDVNTAGREQIMQISDDIIESLKSISKLLYLIRRGSVDYVREEDAQVALNKMSDVARSIGIAANALT